MASIYDGSGGFGDLGLGTGSSTASPAAAYSASGGGNSGGGGKGSDTPKGSYLGGPAISAEDFNSALRSDAAAAYKQGPTQTTYSGLSDASKGAIAGLNNAASSNAGILNQASTYNQGLLSNGGLTGDQTQSMDYFRGVMNGGDDDPAFQRLRANAIDDARTAINRQFGASGRFGSGGQMIDLGRGLADAAAQMDYQNLQRRDAAAQGLFSMAQTGTTNAMGAADRAPEMYQNMLLPYQTQIQSNALLDADAAARAAFDPNYTHLLKYQGLLGNNSAAPQPAKQPGALDYIGAGAGLLTALL